MELYILSFKYALNLGKFKTYPLGLGETITHIFHYKTKEFPHV